MLLSVCMAFAAGLVATATGQLTPDNTVGAPTDATSSNGFCTSVEKQRAFDSCMVNFGFKHIMAFPYLRRNAPVCKAEVFGCPAIDDLMKCLNSQPVSRISNRCWVVIAQVGTEALNKYGIPCTYDDLAKRCNYKTTDLIPVSARRATGRGINNNPVPNFFLNMLQLGMLNEGFGGWFPGFAGLLGA